MTSGAVGVGIGGAGDTIWDRGSCHLAGEVPGEEEEVGDLCIACSSLSSWIWCFTSAAALSCTLGCWGLGHKVGGFKMRGEALK